MADKWLAQVLGDPNGNMWEISVVRESNELGRRSWGWFNEDKLLVSHNGGPCQWPLAQGLGDKMVLLAKLYAEGLNARETPEPAAAGKPTRLAVRVYKGATLISEEPEVIVHSDAELATMAEKHAEMTVSGEITGVELEFLDEPDRQHRFVRVGSTPDRMVNPIAIDLRGLGDA